MCFILQVLIGDPNFAELQNYVGATAHNLLNEMGFDLTNYHCVLLQSYGYKSFAQKGAGYHTLHTHWNGHISGFYFLKASEATSMPLFEDPRPGNLMNLLPEKNKTDVTYASTQINYKVSPGKNDILSIIYATSIYKLIWVMNHLDLYIGTVRQYQIKNKLNNFVKTVLELI